MSDHLTMNLVRAERLIQICRRMHDVAYHLCLPGALRCADARNVCRWSARIGSLSRIFALQSESPAAGARRRYTAFIAKAPTLLAKQKNGSARRHATLPEAGSPFISTI
jgi:hypothetical protein